MRRLALIGLVLVAVSLSACGGGDEKSSGSSSGDLKADSRAKLNARTAVTSMEVCFTDQQTYVDCPVDAAGTTATADETSYEVVAKSKSGAKFTITKDASGGLKRTCSPAGEGGCKAGGKW